LKKKILWNLFWNQLWLNLIIDDYHFNNTRKQKNKPLFWTIHTMNLNPTQRNAHKNIQSIQFQMWLKWLFITFCLKNPYSHMVVFFKIINTICQKFIKNDQLVFKNDHYAHKNTMIWIDIYSHIHTSKFEILKQFNFIQNTINIQIC
jgi:hypothetical protein